MSERANLMICHRRVIKRFLCVSMSIVKESLLLLFQFSLGTFYFHSYVIECVNRNRSLLKSRKRR